MLHQNLATQRESWLNKSILSINIFVPGRLCRHVWTWWCRRVLMTAHAEVALPGLTTSAQPCPARQPVHAAAQSPLVDRGIGGVALMTEAPRWDGAGPVWAPVVRGIGSVTRNSPCVTWRQMSMLKTLHFLFAITFTDLHLHQAIMFLLPVTNVIFKTLLVLWYIIITACNSHQTTKIAALRSNVLQMNVRYMLVHFIIIERTLFA